MSLNRIVLSLFAGAMLFSSSAWATQPDREPAPSGAYVSDPAHSSVIWKVNHLGLSNYTARFTRMTAELNWNAEHPETSSVTATIDPLSVQTNFPFPEREDFDKEIGTEDRFLAGKPIRFISREIKIIDPHHGAVAGDLTFRGETHPAVLNVTFNGSMARQPAADTPKIGFCAEDQVDQRRGNRHHRNGTAAARGIRWRTRHKASEMNHAAPVVLGARRKRRWRRIIQIQQ
jgi:polyisoprenoid-binding protein YceI